MLDLPVYIAAIEGNGHKALVDTGLSDPQKWSAGNPHIQPPEERIDAALAELGWRTTDVNLVINTHMHYDHSGNNLAFPHAQFYVSRAEWISLPIPATPRPGRTNSIGPAPTSPT